MKNENNKIQIWGRADKQQETTHSTTEMMMNEG